MKIGIRKVEKLNLDGVGLAVKFNIMTHDGNEHEFFERLNNDGKVNRDDSMLGENPDQLDDLVLSMIESIHDELDQEL